MAFKAIVLFASALLVQSISCVPCGLGGAGLGLGGVGRGLGGAGLGLGGSGHGLGGVGLGLGVGLGGATSSGGGFPIASASPQSANGLSVLSENQIEGCLDVGGQLPFVGAVGLQGQLPTCGSAAVNYGCGSGHIGINNAGSRGHGGHGGWH